MFYQIDCGLHYPFRYGILLSGVFKSGEFIASFRVEAS